jgi:hypothetical protein
MTLEINEISVHISVGPRPQGAGSSLISSPTDASIQPALPSELWDSIVQRCVREVLHHFRLRERR